MMKMASLVTAALLWAAPAFAACPPGQQAMLTVRLYFGQTADGHQLPAAQWRDFVARSVTPRFPDGFTIYDALGQWRDPRTRTVQREPSKVIEIAAPDTPALRARAQELREIYAHRFHQQSVGLVTMQGCGTF